jgi:hypothetical protein
MAMSIASTASADQDVFDAPGTGGGVAFSDGGEMVVLNPDVFEVILPTAGAFGFQLDPQGLLAVTDSDGNLIAGKSWSDAQDAAGQIIFANTPSVINNSSMPVTVTAAINVTGNATHLVIPPANTPTNSADISDTQKDALLGGTGVLNLLKHNNSTTNTLSMFMVPSVEAVEDIDDALDTGDVGFVLGSAATTFRFVLEGADYELKLAGGKYSLDRDDNPGNGTQIKLGGWINPQADWSNFAADKTLRRAVTAAQITAWNTPNGDNITAANIAIGVEGPARLWTGGGGVLATTSVFAVPSAMTATEINGLVPVTVSQYNAISGLDNAVPTASTPNADWITQTSNRAQAITHNENVAGSGTCSVSGCYGCTTATSTTAVPANQMAAPAANLQHINTPAIPANTAYVARNTTATLSHGLVAKNTAAIARATAATIPATLANIAPTWFAWVHTDSLSTLSADDIVWLPAAITLAQIAIAVPAESNNTAARSIGINATFRFTKSTLAEIEASGRAYDSSTTAEAAKDGIAQLDGDDIAYGLMGLSVRSLRVVDVRAFNFRHVSPSMAGGPSTPGGGTTNPYADVLTAVATFISFDETDTNNAGRQAALTAFRDAFTTAGITIPASITGTPEWEHLLGPAADPLPADWNTTRIGAIKVAVSAYTFA